MIDFSTATQDLKRCTVTRAIVCCLGAFVLVSCVVMTGPPARAQSPTQSEDLKISGDNTATRRITMGIGKSIIVELPDDAAEVFVGNPKVANAVVRSARKLYIIGIDNGQTTVFAMDRQGRRIATLEISIGRDVGELQQIIRAAMPNTSVQARTVNDTIILTGTSARQGLAKGS
jgi:pilus assembly protein CpaC